MKRVVVTDHAFRDVDQEHSMAAAVGAEFSCHQCSNEDETVEAVRGADVVLVNFAPITERVLAAMNGRATVVRYGIGYDNVDIEAAQRLGVSVANVPDYGSDTVADHAAAMVLAMLRRLPHYDRCIKADGWCAPASVGPVASFSSTTVGLIGVGRIARALAIRLGGFGFTILGYDPMLPADAAEAVGVRLASLNEVAEASHALSLHVPATPETHHIINATLIRRMRNGAVLVNTSRGPLVNEADLAAALRVGKLAGAALDVFDPEPLAADSPLRECPTALFTPHAAFYSTEALNTLQRLAAEEAARALRAEPLRCRVA